MKNFLVCFLILLYICSFSCFGLRKNEIEKLKNSLLPEHKKNPFTFLMDKQIHGDMPIPSKMFYLKYALENKLMQTSQTLQLKNDDLKKHFLETKVQIPSTMAKLDVEINIQNFSYNFLEDDEQHFDVELYFGNNKIAENDYNIKRYRFAKTLILSGSLFNVPAGVYPVYLNIRSEKIRSNAYIAVRPSNQVSGYFNSETELKQVNMDTSYLEVVGYPLA